MEDPRPSDLKWGTGVQEPPWSDTTRIGPLPVLFLQISFSPSIPPSETEVHVEAFRWRTSALLWLLQLLFRLGKKESKKRKERKEKKATEYGVRLSVSKWANIAWCQDICEKLPPSSFKKVLYTIFWPLSQTAICYVKTECSNGVLSREWSRTPSVCVVIRASLLFVLVAGPAMRVCWCVRVPPYETVAYFSS